MLNLEKHLLARILLAMTLLGAAVSHGQDEGADPPADTATGPAGADTETARGNASDREPVNRPKSPSPFEYEASEQISEDLSVSFPVDI